jgi:hypothetical protein
LIRSLVKLFRFLVVGLFDSVLPSAKAGQRLFAFPAAQDERAVRTQTGPPPVFFSCRQQPNGKIKCDGGGQERPSHAIQISLQTD